MSWYVLVTGLVEKLADSWQKELADFTFSIVPSPYFLCRDLKARYMGRVERCVVSMSGTVQGNEILFLSKGGW